MKVYDDIEQLSDEWNQLRLGSIGGSSIASVVAVQKKIWKCKKCKHEWPVRKKKSKACPKCKHEKFDEIEIPGKTRMDLLYRFAGEILSGQKYESYSNKHMDRGIEQEHEARECYEFITGNKVKQVGLCKP